MHAEPPMKPWVDLDKVYDASTLARRVSQLGREITADFSAAPLTLIGVLKGSFVFYSDLARAIDRPMRNDFIELSSYGAERETSGAVRMTKALGASIEGEHVVVVEDVVDTGLSVRYLLDHFAGYRPKSLSICTLLDKPSRRRVEVPLDYVGFTIPDIFVVGYGLDHAERYRNLPFLGVYRETD